MTLAEANKLLSQKVPDSFNEKECREIARTLRRVVILKTSWYSEILNGLESSASSYLVDMGVPETSLFTVPVPGSFELPLAAHYVSQSGGQSMGSAAESSVPSSATSPVDLIVALGCVLKGDTPHFDYVCQSVTQGLMDVMLKSGVPVGFGVLTVNSLEQAQARAAKGAEAAQAALLMKVMAKKIGDKKYGF